MHSITASHLRRELFSILDNVESGEVVEIKRHGKAVARLIAAEPQDWRGKMHSVPQLNGSSEEVFAPLDDVWGEYT